MVSKRSTRQRINGREIFRTDVLAIRSTAAFWHANGDCVDRNAYTVRILNAPLVPARLCFSRPAARPARNFPQGLLIAWHARCCGLVRQLDFVASADIHREEAL